MKKILNSSFFGVCFLAALLAEAYIIRIGTGNLFSVVGIGIVALITGYLLLDAIKSGLDQRIRDAKLYLDQIYKEEAEKSSERFTEENNLHKASYTALKKNAQLMSQHAEEMMERLETLEHNMVKALSTMTDLQKKTMEGQRNALNFEINYNKENTKRLIQALREENNHTDVKELLMKLLNSMERNNELLENQLNSIKSSSLEAISEEPEKMSEQTKKVVEVDWKEIAEQEAESFTSTEWDSDIKEPVVENLTETGWDVDAELMVGNITDGWEVSASAGEAVTDESVSEEAASEENPKMVVETESTSEEPQEQEEGGTDSWDDIGMELNDLISNWDIEENAPEAEAAAAAEQEPEAVEIEEEVINTPEAQRSEPSNATVTPLYSDPNKNLTAAEIAALFASLGQ